jgi:hypothetical protein
MAIILSDGERHCDERCYDAKWCGCSCICGGKNHGVGLKQALANAEHMELEEEGDDGSDA